MRRPYLTVQLTRIKLRFPRKITFPHSVARTNINLKTLPWSQRQHCLHRLSWFNGNICAIKWTTENWCLANFICKLLFFRSLKIVANWQWRKYPHKLFFRPLVLRCNGIRSSWSRSWPSGCVHFYTENLYIISLAEPIHYTLTSLLKQMTSFWELSSPLGISSFNKPLCSTITWYYNLSKNPFYWKMSAIWMDVRKCRK